MVKNLSKGFVKYLNDLTDPLNQPGEKVITIAASKKKLDRQTLTAASVLCIIFFFASKFMLG
jgi:hypothetical protein